MTDDRGRPISYLEYRAHKTGKTVAELRAELAQRGKAGGKANKGRTLTEEHKKKLSEAYWRRRNGNS